jgi:hypothetical protein
MIKFFAGMAVILFSYAAENTKKVWLAWQCTAMRWQRLAIAATIRYQ